MRKTCILALAIALLLLMTACSGETIPTEKGENVFGSFACTDMAGNALNEEVFSGHKLTMVNIWGTYCNPCIAEMPDLAELNKAYEEGEFQVVGMIVDMLSTDGSVHPMAVEAAWQIIDATGADYMHLLPTEDIITMKLQYLMAVPETVFVDSEGNILTPDTQYLGARSYEDWKAVIDELLLTLPDLPEEESV